MKRPLSRYAWRTGQTSIPTGGFTDGEGYPCAHRAPDTPNSPLCTTPERMPAPMLWRPLVSSAIRSGPIGPVCRPRRTRGWFSENRPDDPVSDRDSRVRPSAALKTGTRPFQRTRSDGAVCRQTGAVTAGSGFPRTGYFGTSITALRQCTRIEPSPRIPADGLEVLNDR